MTIHCEARNVRKKFWASIGAIGLKAQFDLRLWVWVSKYTKDSVQLVKRSVGIQSRLSAVICTKLVMADQTQDTPNASDTLYWPSKAALRDEDSILVPCTYVAITSSQRRSNGWVHRYQN
jgi:hypothetical protein